MTDGTPSGYTKSMLRRLRTRFHQLRLRHKYVVVIGACVAFLSASSVVTFRIVLNQYSRIAYDGVASVLHLASRIVERELTLAQELALRVATDVVVQEALDGLTGQPSAYERSVYLQNIRSSLSRLSLEYPYVDAVLVKTLDGRVLSSHVPLPLMPDRVRYGADQIVSREVIFPDDASGRIWIGIRVRKIRDFSLEPLGTIFLSINLHRVVAYFGGLPSDFAHHLLVLHEGRPVYATPGVPRIELDPARLAQGTGYDIVTDDGVRYIAAVAPSRTLDLTYLYFLPERAVLARADAAAVILAIGISLAILATLCGGSLLSRRITRPIEHLSAQLERMSDGDFSPVTLEYEDCGGQDEVAEFARDFNEMASRIDRLMKDNYLSRIERTEAQLRALQSQISPHFLYNTLDSIGWLARTGRMEAVAEMVEALGNLMRAALDQSTPEIPLRTEIAHVRDYIAIQQHRFGKRLRFTVRVPEPMQGVLIPRLTLQPLVENCIQYGLEPTAEGCTIEVLGRRSGPTVELIVRDDGPGIDERTLERIRENRLEPSSRGVGIGNIQRRFALLYGARYGLSVQRCTPRGTQVTVIAPWRSELTQPIRREEPERA